MRGLIRAVALIGVIALATSCEKAHDNKGTAKGGGQQKLSIAVIPKGTTQQFWKSVEAGARDAERELGVNVIWKGPIKEDDRAQQIAITEQFVTDQVDAIAIAPLDDAALVKPVQEAAEKKIPVVIFDSALRGEAGKDFATFVATDNHLGGKLGGEQLVKILDGKGKVVLFRYAEGSASTSEREAGFLEVMKAHAPGIQVISDNRYAGVTAAEAQKASMNMLDTLKEATGIFCPNESSTVGMILTLRQANLNGKVKLVGFDTSPALIEYLRQGDVDALVAQNPRKMGYEAVKAAAAVARGEKVQPRIDTGVRVITKADLDDPEVKKLLGI
jgi:ribose transport system substrate-binding protein